MSAVITYQQAHDTNELEITLGWLDSNFQQVKKKIEESKKSIKT